MLITHKYFLSFVNNIFNIFTCPILVWVSATLKKHAGNTKRRKNMSAKPFAADVNKSVGGKRNADDFSLKGIISLFCRFYIGQKIGICRTVFLFDYLFRTNFVAFSKIHFFAEKFLVQIFTSLCSLVEWFSKLLTDEPDKISFWGEIEQFVRTGALWLELIMFLT